MNYTCQEMMAIAAGREIGDGELAIFGVSLNLLDRSLRRIHFRRRCLACCNDCSIDSWSNAGTKARSKPCWLP